MVGGAVAHPHFDRLNQGDFLMLPHHLGIETFRIHITPQLRDILHRITIQARVSMKVLLQPLMVQDTVGRILKALLLFLNTTPCRLKMSELPAPGPVDHPMVDRLLMVHMITVLLLLLVLLTQHINNSLVSS